MFIREGGEVSDLGKLCLWLHMLRQGDENEFNFYSFDSILSHYLNITVDTFKLANMMPNKNNQYPAV